MKKKSVSRGDERQVTPVVGNVVRSAVDAVHHASRKLAVVLVFQPPQGVHFIAEANTIKAGVGVLFVVLGDDERQVTPVVGNVVRSAVDAVHHASRPELSVALLPPGTACNESHTYHPTKFQEPRVPFGSWFSLCERLQHWVRHAGELRKNVKWVVSHEILMAK